MSRKYQRIKQHDLALPAPVRWLTRAFSSIRLAVTLLTFVCLYGLVASVPVGYLLLGTVYMLIGVGVFGMFGVPLALIQNRIPILVAVLSWVSIAIIGTWLTWMACFQAFDTITHLALWQQYGRVIIYQTPALEMTELEFYSWWPMQLVLILFVVNMIWATLRRIEFTFPNLGVLTVHTGIVVLTLGSILYSSFKVEGDTILFRRDLGGGFEKSFYDAVDPAVYVTLEGVGQAMIPVVELPRYNDYPRGTLDIPLVDRAGLRPMLPEPVEVSIVGFYPDAELVEQRGELVPRVVELGVDDRLRRHETGRHDTRLEPQLAHA